MLILNPYETTYGKMLHADRLIKPLSMYYTTSGDINLNYECTDNKNLVFITGYNAEEENLPMFNHPCIFEDVKGEKHIAVDLRKYVKKVNEQPLNILDIAKDKSSVLNLMYNAIIISDLLNDNYGEYRPLFNPITTAYSFFISYLVDIVVKLSPLEKVDAELAALFSANVMLIPDSTEKTDEYLDTIAARMAQCKLSIPYTKKSVEQTIANVVSYDSTFNAVVANVNAVLPEEKASLINSQILAGLMSNIWYGPGSEESLIIALESMPLWMCIVYSAISDNTYKRSRLTSILDKYSRQINSKEFIKNMDLIMKEKINSKGV